MTDNSRFKPSRFNFRTRNSQGEMIVYNSYTGAIGIVPPDKESLAEAVLRPSQQVELHDELLHELAEGGLLIPIEEDEFEKAKKLHLDMFQKQDELWLTIMPTEECNFRCVYCYEEFKVKEMPVHVKEGIKKLVSERASQLKFLSISWFGGEPTEAPDLVQELSAFFIKTCEQHGIEYSSHMTTNGYNLTPDLAKKLIEDCQITKFNITLDGIESEHNTRRMLKGGGETFSQIFSNLLWLHQSDLTFYCQLRTNFDRESLPKIADLMNCLNEKLEGDPRFPVYYRNIGRWGGPNDDHLPVCDGSAGIKAMYDLHKQAKTKGLPIAMLAENLGPTNSVCYAALPYSLVIGADGTIYKCTVALDKDYNKVGKFDSEGLLQIDPEKFALWVDSNETIDIGCQKCFFRPSCQGAACPYERIENGIQPCPPSKTHLKHVLDVLSMEDIETERG